MPEAATMQIAKALSKLAVVAVSILAPATASNVYFQPESGGDMVAYYIDSGETVSLINFDTSMGLGNCGCSDVPAAWPSVCVYFHLEGQPVTTYSGFSCTGSKMGYYEGVDDVNECGWNTFQTNSIWIQC